MLRMVLIGTIATLALGVVTPAHALSITVGTASTFSLNGTPLKPGPARRAPIGPEVPNRDEITVGLAPAGHAVQVAKLHVYERTSAPIAFKATAMRGGKPVSSRIVCGQLEMDAWVTFPAGTRTVRLSDFALEKPDCVR